MQSYNFKLVFYHYVPNQKIKSSTWTNEIEAGKAWDIDYILPLALGGTNEPDNLQILCKPCHRAKTTKSDVPRIAKTKRLKARHLGAHAPSTRPIPGSRRSPWKRKMDGSVVKRI